MPVKNSRTITTHFLPLVLWHLHFCFHIHMHRNNSETGQSRSQNAVKNILSYPVFKPTFCGLEWRCPNRCGPAKFVYGSMLHIGSLHHSLPNITLFLSCFNLPKFYCLNTFYQCNYVYCLVLLTYAEIDHRALRAIDEAEKTERRLLDTLKSLSLPLGFGSISSRVEGCRSSLWSQDRYPTWLSHVEGFIYHIAGHYITSEFLFYTQMHWNKWETDQRLQNTEKHPVLPIILTRLLQVDVKAS